MQKIGAGLEFPQSPGDVASVASDEILVRLVQILGPVVEGVVGDVLLSFTVPSR